MGHRGTQGNTEGDRGTHGGHRVYREMHGDTEGYMGIHPFYLIISICCWISILLICWMKKCSNCSKIFLKS